MTPSNTPATPPNFPDALLALSKLQTTDSKTATCLTSNTSSGQQPIQVTASSGSNGHNRQCWR